MPKIHAICTSAEKGTAKHSAAEGELVAGHGIKGDAHAGNWHRQVSLLPLEKIEAFRRQGAAVEFGAFGENLVVEGIDFRSLPLGSRLRCGTVVLEITQFGKECHNHCAIYRQMGDCIMPREGVFAKVLHGGTVKPGDEINVEKKAAYRAAIITASDKGARGEREDNSGPVAREIAEAAGFAVEIQTLLPDEQGQLEAELKRICDNNLADVVFTTGGTGCSPRDRTPEATLAIAERQVPGIAEAMRFHSMAITKRAMLSRAVSVIRKKTIVINLPGSPRAVRENLGYIIDELSHAIDTLTGNTDECARQ